jgi:succinate dehydrogenase / fumarate reductase cytochrome b subunit
MSTKTQRPLSPHLQIYKPQLTSVMSILHRFSGFALAVGTLMVVWLLVSTAMGEGAFLFYSSFASSIIGKLMLFGWSAAFYYHLCNGIRHLLWDSGRLFSLEKAYLAGYIVLFSSCLMTVLTWCLLV